MLVLLNFNTGLLYTVVIAGDATRCRVPLPMKHLLAASSPDEVLTRIGHGSFDAPAIDIYTEDGTKIIVGAYNPVKLHLTLRLPSGDLGLAIREAGSPPNSEPVASPRD